jgi:hypothetical protein
MFQRLVAAFRFERHVRILNTPGLRAACCRFGEPACWQKIDRGKRSLPLESMRYQEEFLSHAKTRKRREARGENALTTLIKHLFFSYFASSRLRVSPSRIPISPSHQMPIQDRTERETYIKLREGFLTSPLSTLLNFRCLTGAKQRREEKDRECFDLLINHLFFSYFAPSRLRVKPIEHSMSPDHCPT